MYTSIVNRVYTYTKTYPTGEGHVTNCGCEECAGYAVQTHDEDSNETFTSNSVYISAESYEQYPHDIKLIKKKLGDRNKKRAVVKPRATQDKLVNRQHDRNFQRLLLRVQHR